MTDDPRAQMLRQAAYDAVRSVLASPPDSEEGSRALYDVIDWVAREHGNAAVAELAFQLALDFAAALDVLADAQQLDLLSLADRWFHETAIPDGPDAAAGPGQAG